MAQQKKQSKKTNRPQQATRVRKLDYKQKKKVIKKSVKVAGSFRLFGRAWRHMWRHKKLFGGILFVYALLYVLLVKGIAANFKLSETRDAINAAVDGGLGNLEMASSLFGALLGTAGSTASESAGVFQTVLFVLVSLAIIWALRQTFSDRKTPPIRQAFYSGPAQIVPYILVLLVITLQMIPALIGVTIYGIVITNGIAVGFLEQAVWLIILLALMGLSVFWVSASVFASYIVTLPNMAPMQALRSAKQLVRFRRWIIIRKVLFLPLIMGLIMLLIFMPLVLLAPVIAEVLFLIFVLILLLFGHSYFYLLYRELMG